MLRFHELRNPGSSYFHSVIRYCRDMFHCSLEDIKSLADRIPVQDNRQVSAHIIFADYFGEMVGFIIFYYIPKSKVGFVEALVVFDKYRDQGIGGQLYREMMNFLQMNCRECRGHLLELCQEKDNYEKRKEFFLRQGCIPLDLGFFAIDATVRQSGIQILYHPYRINQEYSLSTMKEIFSELDRGLLH